MRRRLITMLRSFELPRIRIPEQSERSIEIQRNARDVRMQSAMILEEARRVRQEANGLWATDLLADREHRAGAS